MKRTVFFLTAFLLAETALAAPPPAARRQPLKFAPQLLPTVVDMIAIDAIAASGDRHPPRFAAIALGKDEYVYSLLDKKFIRVIKNRFELPPWQVCGDWASVRVALMGEFMEAAAPETVWFLTFRNGRWVRLHRDSDGQFFKGLDPADVPPYAVRCFNLDHRDLTD